MNLEEGSMNRILIDLPEIIETPRLILHMPKAGFGKKLYEAIIEGYHDGMEWLGWPPTEPTMESVEEDCRKYHADFILREFIRYIIIEKATDMGLGRCTFPAPYVCFFSEEMLPPLEVKW